VIVEFDVAVAGGGPAGAVVALCLARRGWRVALLEATAFDGDRYGETLPPEINPALRRLGLWEPFQALSPLEAPGIVSVWGDPRPHEQDFIANAHGPGWHIDRNRFDRMLCEEARKAGAQTFLSCRVHACTWKDGAWHLGELRARVMVDAAGRNGLRLDGDGGREHEDVLLAIASRIVYDGASPHDLRTCIETTRAGWWYTAPLPQGDAILMFFTDREVYRREGVSLAEQLADAPLTSRRMQSGRIARSQIVYAPSSCRRMLFGDGWVAAGDSASCYDPLSGRGIFKALDQGETAAAAVNARLRGDRDAMGRYAAQVRQEFAEYVRQRRAYYAMERRWSDHPFWRARLYLPRFHP
jgi:flavin-dependent dehydrogenase